MHAMSFPQFAIIVLAFIAIAALAAYEWMTRIRPVPLSKQDQDAVAEARAAIAYAVQDIALEYITVSRLGYSNRDARAHVRAYINVHHSTFNEAMRASIQRQAIHAARQRLDVYDEMTFKDINEVPRAAA